MMTPEDREMLQNPDMGFSLITSFGCHFTCDYCIWKTHPLMNHKWKPDLVFIEECLANLPDDKFSISGGGDPFYNFMQNRQFYDLILRLANKYNKGVDVHTSITSVSKDYIKQFRKIVLHISADDMINRVLNLSRLIKRTNVRIAVVLTKDVTIRGIQRLENICESYNSQIAYRELVGFPDMLPSDKVVQYAKSSTERNDDFKYVNQADYNVYLMPDNKLYNNFSLRS